MSSCRADFKTVQMETYPGWDTCLHSRPLPAKLKEQLLLKEQSPAARMVCVFCADFSSVFVYL